MNQTPLISIITPVWNGLPFLKECVASVLKQEYANWELLISDDGSTDGSREYLSTLDDARIQVCFQEQNLGIFGNLNALFEKAKGEYSQLLCQDDFFTDGTALNKIASYWQTAEASVAFVRFNYINIRNTAATIFPDTSYPTVIRSSEAPLCFYTSGNIPGNLSNISLRTSAVQQYGGFRVDLPYAGDFEFWARLAEQQDFAIQSDYLIFVRRHPGAASNFLNKRGEILRQKLVIINHLYDVLIEQKRYSLFLLKLMGTLVYDSQDRWTGFRYLLKGNADYIKALEQAAKDSKFVYRSVSMRWLVFCLSLGGRIGRAPLAAILAKQYGTMFSGRLVQNQ